MIKKSKLSSKLTMTNSKAVKKPNPKVRCECGLVLLKSSIREHRLSGRHRWHFFTNNPDYQKYTPPPANYTILSVSSR